MVDHTICISIFKLGWVTPCIVADETVTVGEIAAFSRKFVLSMSLMTFSVIYHLSVQKCSTQDLLYGNLHKETKINQSNFRHKGLNIIYAIGLFYIVCTASNHIPRIPSGLYIFYTYRLYTSNKKCIFLNHLNHLLQMLWEAEDHLDVIQCDL